jgi:cytochrome P450
MKNHWFWGQTKNFAGNTLGFIQNLQEGNLAQYSCKIGFKNFHFLLHPNLINEVLQKQNKHFKKSFAYKGLADFLGKGLLTNEGEDWLEKRRLLQPQFNKENISSLADNISLCTKNYLEKNKGKNLDLRHFSIELITEIISSILFSDSELKMNGSELSDILLTLRTHANDRLKNPLKPPLWIPTAKNRTFKESLSNLKSFLNNQINNRIDKKDNNDLLQYLIDLHHLNPTVFNLQQLIDELITLYLAGQETTSNALTFIIHQIESHTQVKKELLLSLEKGETNFLKAIINEGLRLFPPAWAVSREALNAIQIEDLAIKKGDTVFVSIYAMHRHPEFWTNSNEFKPERFLETENLKNNAYLPFGKGNRFCIGNHLALLELEIILSQLYSYSVNCETTNLQLITPMTLGVKNKIGFNFY